MILTAYRHARPLDRAPHPGKSGTVEREPMPAFLATHAIKTTEASNRSRMDGTIHRPEKRRQRSLRKLPKHVRVSIHEVNSDIDGASAQAE